MAIARVASKRNLLRRGSLPETKSPRINRYARKLRVEPLEDRSLLSVALTNTALSVSAVSVTYGQPVIFTATVTVSSPVVTPVSTFAPTGGSVTFFDGTATLGSSPLSASGI